MRKQLSLHNAGIIMMLMFGGLALFTAGCNKGTPNGPSDGLGDSPTDLSRAVSTNNFYSPECTWGVDTMTARAGWKLTFSRTSNRNAYKWYGEKLVTNGGYSSSGKSGNIMVFNTSSAMPVGHVAYVTSSGLWNGKRAWTVRHSNWPGTYGQWNAETISGVTIKQCTFVEDSPGKLKIQNGTSLGATAYPLYGFIYKK